jgi:streptogramin lyase
MRSHKNWGTPKSLDMLIREASPGRIEKMRRLLLVSGILAGAMAANALLWPAAGNAQHFTPFPLPDCHCNGRAITAITAGPDGNLWYVDTGAALVGRITTSGVVTEFPLSHPVTQLSSIVAGTDGALWFGEALADNSGVIGRITTAGVISHEFAVATTEGPLDPFVTWGPDGNVWFVNPSDDQPILGTVTPTGTYTPRCFPANSPDGCADVMDVQHGISPGPDGAIWFSGRDHISQHPALGRITTGGTISEAIPDITGMVGSIPVLVNGPDGALWFTIPQTNSLWRATTGGALSHTEIPNFTFCGAGHASLTVGHDGALWLNGCQLPNAIVRVTTGGTVTTYPAGATGSFSAITAGPDGNIWIADNGGNGGVATIWRFVPGAATHDFNNDSRADIAWRDGSGNIGFWLMNGAAVLSSGGIGGVPAAWSIVGQRDFDGDGKADLLWRDTSGNTAIWFMNGAQIASAVGIGNIPPIWSVLATGDFDGDGKGDILWRDSSGNVAVWLMNGATMTSSAGLGNVPTTWTVAGTGDFNKDGKADLLWLDNLGNIAMWFMNGTQVGSTAVVANIPTIWSVAGTGDFDGDGKSDIVWRDNVGNTAIWLMNGAAIASAGALGDIPMIWSIAQTGDYDNDGKSDLLWRDTNGNTVMWFMSGLAVSSAAGIGVVPPVWIVQSVNAE